VRRAALNEPVGVDREHSEHHPRSAALGWGVADVLRVRDVRMTLTLGESAPSGLRNLPPTTATSVGFRGEPQDPRRSEGPDFRLAPVRLSGAVPSRARRQVRR
jgi:hypothetical protein